MFEHGIETVEVNDPNVESPIEEGGSREPQEKIIILI